MQAISDMLNVDGSPFSNVEAAALANTLAHIVSRQNCHARDWALVPSPIPEADCIPDPKINEQSVTGADLKELRSSYEKVYGSIARAFFSLIAPVLWFSRRDTIQQPTVVSLASEFGIEHLILPRLYPRGFRFIAADINDDGMDFERKLYPAPKYQFLKVDCSNFNNLGEIKADVVFIRHQASSSYGKTFADILFTGMKILKPNGRMIVTSYTSSEQGELLTLLEEFYPDLKPFRIEQNKFPVSAVDSQLREGWRYDSDALIFGKDEEGNLLTYESPHRSWKD